MNGAKNDVGRAVRAEIADGVLRTMAEDDKRAVWRLFSDHSEDAIFQESLSCLQDAAIYVLVGFS